MQRFFPILFVYFKKFANKNTLTQQINANTNKKVQNKFNNYCGTYRKQAHV
jgi:hypothetical protein